MLRYRYLKANEMTPEQRLAYLQEAHEKWPTDKRVYEQLLTEYAVQRDAAGVYLTIKQWLGDDSSRQQLGVMRRLFVLPEGGSAGAQVTAGKTGVAP